jgi:hypothetical protein
MASRSTFQPVPPIRTNTVDSQSSGSFSPTSPMSGTTSPTSPAEHKFFSAISTRIRGRSRSRSRDASHKRSKSPMMSPPTQIAAQPQQARHVSIASPTKPVRPSMQAGGRRSTGGSDPWRGRHSNEWLFGNWSATETAKGFVQKRKQ